MPYQTIKENNGIYWQFYGVVSFSEIMSANNEIWSIPNWSMIRYEIVDFLNVDKLDLRDHDATAVAKMDMAASSSCPIMRVAFIAVTTDTIEACNSYIEGINAPGWEAQVFADLPAARKWCIA